MISALSILSNASKSSDAIYKALSLDVIFKSTHSFSTLSILFGFTVVFNDSIIFKARINLSIILAFISDAVASVKLTTSISFIEYSFSVNNLKTR